MIWRSPERDELETYGAPRGNQMKASLAAGERLEESGSKDAVEDDFSAETLTGGTLKTIYGGIEDDRDLSGFLSDCGG